MYNLLRPRAAELKGRIMHIANTEGIQIANNVLEELAAGTQSDIRQILNLLSTYKLSQSTLDYDSSKTL
jgi:replication factor C subunit 1